MKVILLQDVAKIGRKHTIVNVPDGYGQNQLIPKGLAKPATPENIKAVERIKAEKGAKEDAALTRFFETKKALEGKTVDLKGRRSDNGHLFAAVKPEEIVEAAKEAGVSLEKGMLKLTTPIKTTGLHLVEISHQGHKAEFKLNIE